MKASSNLLLLAIALLSSTMASSSEGVISMVKDLSVQPAGFDSTYDSPQAGHHLQFTRAGDQVFFLASDGLHGMEMWVSDGTEEGTRMVKDINPAPRHDSVDEYIFFVVAVGGRVFFLADDGTHGEALWVSDGTEVGTVMAKDFSPGDPTSSAPTNLGQGCGIGETLFFRVDDPEGIGTELWKSDGTDAGTVLVKDINPSGSSVPSHMFDFEGKLVFWATDGVHDGEPWISDGTEAGTVMIKDINPSGSSLPWGASQYERVVHDGRLFFVADDGVNGSELWVTDGTEENTYMVHDCYRGAFSSYPTDLGIVGGQLYFEALRGASQTAVWITDGTTEGTEIFMYPASYPGYFTEYNGFAYFNANRGLWRTDGTQAGTEEIIPDVSPSKLTVVGDTLCFTGSPGQETYLYVSDGSLGGTWSASATYPELICPAELIDLNGTLMLAGSNAVHGVELWGFNPSGPGSCSLVKDIHPGTRGTGIGNLWGVEFLDIEETAFFVAAEYENPEDRRIGLELWKSDGTPEGTAMVKDINPGAGWGDPGSYPRDFVNINGTLFFTADHHEYHRELWKSDGSEEGTVMVKNIYQADREDDNWKNPRSLVLYQDGLFFIAYDEEHGAEIWTSDGTEEGTVLAAETIPGTYASVGELAVFKDRLFFAANAPDTGRELWTSDGTTERTQLFKDLRPGGEIMPLSSGPQSLTVYGDALYFTAVNESRRAVWASDGTPEGTIQLSDIHTDENARLVSANGFVLFVAEDETHGAELWATDGTPAGTAIVKDIHPGSESSMIIGDSEFAVVNDILFFIAQDCPWTEDALPPGVTGRELWKSDGTPEGTVLVKDIYPNAGPELFGEFRNLTEANGLLYFVASDQEHGPELWVSDGTEAGTHMVIDLTPGSLPGEGLGPTILGTISNSPGGVETLLFFADDGVHGRELWKLAPPSLALVGPIRALTGSFSFSFEASLEKTFRIDRSSDLFHWDPIETISDREGTVPFEDGEAGPADRYFYRVVELE